mgnify:CR=1 FL=1
MIKLKDIITEGKGKQIGSMWNGIKKENAKIRADAINKANKKIEKKHKVFATTYIVKKNYKKGNPLLGICLGMQMLMSRSEEFGNNSGLSIIKGKIKKIKRQKKIKLPFISRYYYEASEFLG